MYPLEIVKQLSISLISSLGYSGIFFLMFLNAALFPVPSEIVLPFAGYLSTLGTFEFRWVVLYAVLGNFFGSLLAYYVGLKLGRRIVEKYGKILLIERKHLVYTEKFFKEHGEAAVLIGRIIPVIRSLISLPAGMGRMNIWKFCFYTLVGSFIWDLPFTFLGVWFGNNWEYVMGSVGKIKVIIFLGLLAVLVMWIRKRIKEVR